MKKALINLCNETILVHETFSLYFIRKDNFFSFSFYQKLEDSWHSRYVLAHFKDTFSLTHNMRTDTGNTIVLDRKCRDWSLKWQEVEEREQQMISDCVLYYNQNLIYLAWNKQISYFWIWKKIISWIK